MQDTIKGFVEALCFSQSGKRIAGEAWRLDSGLIDSVGIFELVATLEEAFGIAIPDEDVVPANFASVARIAEYVDRKRRG